MAVFMGIDIGSETSKGIIIRNGKISADHILTSGINYRVAAQGVYDELLNKAGLTADIAGIVTTGHGTNIIPFKSKNIPDMLCCARGINYIFPQARIVIDIQRQSSQVIQLDEKGKVTNFAASESCASGSGYFLEVIAHVLRLDLNDIGRLSLESKNPVVFTTGCAVFGESEVISRVSEGVSKEDILAGVHEALVSKISALIDRVGLREECAISGGGGLNIGLIKRLERLGLTLMVPPQPLLVNAIGAALIAGE
jgi:(R)-2-hydroxyacyl-CoA dehydratese activating ATPase